MKFAVLMLAALMPFVVAHSSIAADEPAANGPVYHIVCFKFKPDATPQRIKAVEDAFENLKTKIPLIQTLHWGTNVSPEHRNKGFTHAFVLTFANEKDRDAYLVDPAHKAFGALAGEVVADVFVIDFIAKD